MEMFLSIIPLLNTHLGHFLRQPRCLSLHHSGPTLILDVEVAMFPTGRQPPIPLEKEQAVMLQIFFPCQVPSIHPLSSLLPGMK